MTFQQWLGTGTLQGVAQSQRSSLTISGEPPWRTQIATRVTGR
nr:unnamed protein product [Callosobruchus chinensis]